MSKTLSELLEDASGGPVRKAVDAAWKSRPQNFSVKTQMSAFRSELDAQSDAVAKKHAAKLKPLLADLRKAAGRIDAAVSKLESEHGIQRKRVSKREMLTASRHNPSALQGDVYKLKMFLFLLEKAYDSLDAIWRAIGDSGDVKRGVKYAGGHLSVLEASIAAAKDVCPA